MLWKARLGLGVLLAMALLLAACGGTAGEGSSAGDPAAGEGSSIGDPAAGEALFNESVLGGNPGCITCHSLEPGVVVAGPSLAGIGSRAAQQVEGMTAEDYLRQSILEPDAHIVEGFSAGIMPSNWGEVLSEEDINNLIAYLLTLK